MKKIPLLITLLVSGCSGIDSTFEPNQGFEFYPRAQTEQQRSALLGKWKGERISDRDRILWLVARYPDGTYTIEFRLTEANGDSDSWTEYGIWGVRKPIYFSATRGYVVNGELKPTDVSRASLYDAYRIDTLDPVTFSYTSYTSGNSFTSTKMPEDYELPDKR